MANALLIEPMAFSSVTASATAAGYAAANIGRDEMGLVWKSPTGAATRNLIIDLGSDRAVDSIALFGLRGALPAWQWAVELATSAQGAFTGAFWAGAVTDLLAGSVMPVSGLGKALWQAPAGAPAAARYVRIKFSVLGTAAVEVARAVIGTGITLGRNFRYGAAFGVRPLGTLDFSVRGVLLRRRGVKLRGVGITFAHVYRDEVEARVQPLIERIGNDEALVLVTDPAADANRQGRMFFGFLTGDLGTVWARPGGYQADFNLVALD
jgi:hypothetical protein